MSHAMFEPVLLGLDTSGRWKALYSFKPSHMKGWSFTKVLLLKLPKNIEERKILAHSLRVWYYTYTDFEAFDFITGLGDKPVDIQKLIKGLFNDNTK